MNNQPLVVAYGGGVNSTAMLVEFSRRGIRPDLILFADTGGERPETYETVKAVSRWIVERGMPEIEVVASHSGPLEQDCLRRKALPSIAYGWKTCSDRWKIRPQQKRIREIYGKNASWRQAIGYDAGESRRSKMNPDTLVTNWYPLIEWDIYREDCVEICKNARLPIAKSSCFFCPSSKKAEVIELSEKHPELFKRATDMEENAELTSIKGLGRSYSWRDLVHSKQPQAECDLNRQDNEIPCGCYDG